MKQHYNYIRQNNKTHNNAVTYKQYSKKIRNKLTRHKISLEHTNNIIMI